MNTHAVYLPGLPNLEPQTWTRTEAHAAWALIVAHVLGVSVCEMFDFAPPKGGNSPVEVEGLAKNWVVWIDGWGVGHVIRLRPVTPDADMAQAALDDLAQRGLSAESLIAMRDTLNWLARGVGGFSQDVDLTIRTFLTDVGKQLRQQAKALRPQPQALVA